MNTATSIINKRVFTLLTPFCKRILLLLTTLLLAAAAVQAQGFTIGELRYEVIIDIYPYTPNMVSVSAADINISGDITIPATVMNEGITYTVISIGSFNDCSSLTSVSIPENVTSVGDNSPFYGCSSLTGITVASNNPSYSSESGVLFDKNKETIIQYPVGKTDNSYTIPESVTFIEGGAFYDCINLTEITVASNNPSYSSESGVLFDKNKERIVQYPTGKTDSYIIPESVTFIERRAFYGCINLTSITIPKGVTNISSYTFSGCSSLTEITVASNNPSYSSESGVLFDKNKERIILYPAEKTDNSYIIPESVTSIEGSAFDGCINLTSVTIPSSVTSIDNYAFRGCNSLTGITVASNNPIYSSESDVLFDKNKVAIVRYPEGKTDNSYTIPGSVTVIVEGAFIGCNSLKSIIIPEGILSIGVRAFMDCSSLASITIINVTSIGHEAFAGCTGLQSVEVKWPIPCTIWYVFNRVNLSQVTLIVPYGTKDKYEQAEGWRDFGSIIYSGETPGTDSPQNFTIGNFRYDVNAGNSNTVSVSAANKNISGDITISSAVTYEEVTYTVTGIGSEGFSSCTRLTSVIIPVSVASIGDNAFKGCTGLQSFEVKWTEPLAISSTVFDNVDLREVRLIVPDGTKALYEQANVWRYFGSIEIPGTDPPAQAQSFTIGDFRYHINTGSGNTVSVSAAHDSISGDITIPSTAVNENVTYTVTTVGNEGFYDCRRLASVIIPAGVISLGDSAFYGCSRLASITIPGSVTTIGDEAFRGCHSLASVIISSGVTSIAHSTFRDCGNLSSVTLSEGITSIGEDAFSYCSRLASITIPGSVTTIGDYAFAGCTGLQSVEVKWAEPLAVSTLVFYTINLSQVKLITPDGTEAKYKQADVWRNFGSFNATSVSGAPAANVLRAYTGGGMLHISGLIPGERFYIYDLQGRQLYDSRATDGTQTLPLSSSGPCIVTTGRQSVKVWP
jgi:hypothetical protein